MTSVSPDQILSQFPFETNCHDAHFSGPPSTWQPENHGAVFHVEGRILYSLARAHGGPVLEIGSDLGVSTRYICEGLDARDDPAGVVYAVDPFHKWDDDPSWPRRIRISGDGATFDPLLSCTWAYVDGDHRHDGVCADIKNCLRQKIPLLVFHDTAPRFTHIPTNTSDGSEARRAVTEMLPEDEWFLQDVSSPCGLIIAHKK